MISIKPPTNIDNFSTPHVVFLAGSIENGKAINWQADIEQTFKDEKITFLNPRRDDWNPNLVQSIKELEFKEQVEWELKYITSAPHVIFYFQGNTLSPVSMMEFGLICGANKNNVGYVSTNVMVCCEKNFWRRGNIEVMCDRYDIVLVDTLDQLKNILARSVARHG